MEAIETRDTKKCPACAEEILRNAKKCRYCGEWLHEKGSISASGNKPAQKGNALVSELFKWIGILWTLLYLFLVISFALYASSGSSEAEKVTNAEVIFEMKLMAGIWLAIAGPAFMVFALTKRR